MKLSAAAIATQGQLIGADLDFTRVSTDTRSISPGDLFVALRGENFDAHAFLAEAKSAGACAALVEQPVSEFASYIQVNDSRRGLGHLAASWTDQFALTRVAVTGNAGKTTVKEMIACMLADEQGADAESQVLATRGNLNNDIGVPLTLLSVRESHQFGVFELGANAPGEIAWTASLVRPVIALITNVTGAHLEGFGSMQGIAEAKAEIFTGMAPGGIAIVNREDSFASFFARRAQENGLRVLHVGLASQNDFSAGDIEHTRDACHCSIHFDGGVCAAHIPLPGAHQIVNALMAIAAVVSAGVNIELALARLQALRPVKGRMNLLNCLGGTVVDDTYNANPGSVRAAIDWLAQQSAPRALVLGAMGELGEFTESIQTELGEYAKHAGINLLVAVGAAAPAAKGFGDGAVQVGDAESAARHVKAYLEKQGTVLVKGSRSARMEAVIEALRAMGEIH